MEVLFLLFFLLAILILSIVCLKWNRSSGSITKGVDIPEPPSLPLIGHSFSFKLQNAHFVCAEYAERYGKLFQLRLFGQKIVIINDYKLLKRAFASAEYGDVFNGTPVNFGGKYLYEDIVNRKQSPGQLVKVRLIMRRMMHTRLKLLGDGAKQLESNIHQELKYLVDEIKKYNAKDIDIGQILKDSFSQWVVKLITGKAAKPNDSKLIWTWIDMANAVLSPEVGLILGSFPVLRKLPGKYGDILRSAKQARDKCLERFVLSVDKHEENNIFKIFYDMQSDENAKAGFQLISDFYLLILVADIIFTSIETTCAAVINGLAFFLQFPESGIRIQNEIDRIVGQSRSPTLADRPNMPYTNAAILEIFRYTSQNPLPIPRRAVEDTVLEGFYVQKDSNVFFNSWYIHHDPRIWQDPWNFRPERFLDSKGCLLPLEHELRQAVVTFSFGKKSCPGETLAMMRMFLYITRLLQEFDLRAPSTKKLPNTDPRTYKYGLNLRVEDFLCQVVCRDIS